MPRKERVGRSGWRLGDRLGVTVQRGVGSGGTFKAGGPTRTDSSKEQGGWLRGERERDKVERVSYGRDRKNILLGLTGLTKS